MSPENGHQSNWGRWGPDDELGAANLITPEALVQAAGLVRRGKVYRLALPLQQGKTPVHPSRVPPMHFMALDGGDYAAGVRLQNDVQIADDFVFLNCHAGTHVDALAHVWYDNLLYNGHPANRVRSYGATRCGIENAPWLVGRGVLLDVAGRCGVQHLPGGHVIGGEDLEACVSAQGVTLGPGDYVLIRTGWRTVLDRAPGEYHRHSPGIDLEAGRWLASHDICAVGADNTALEVVKEGASYGGENGDLPVHKLLLRDLGVYILELLDLEALAADRTYEFLFVAAPLPIVGASASPLSPLAIA